MYFVAQGAVLSKCSFSIGYGKRGIGQKLYCLYLFIFYDNEKAAVVITTYYYVVCLPV